MERKKYIYFSWQITWSYLWTILKSPLKTWLELINKFNKVVVLNIDIQKSIVFISISSELSRNEIKITTIAIIAPKWINILRNKLNKRASLVPQMVKNLPAMQETQFRFLGSGRPLEKRLATHSSILAWRIPRTEEPGGLQFMESQRVGYDWATNTHTQTWQKKMYKTMLKKLKTSVKRKVLYLWI